MADVLSSVASAITVAAFAGDFIRFLFRVVRGLASVPDHIHHLFAALESLQITLLGLQRCGANMDADRQFSLQFHRRLGDCLSDLKTFNEKITKIYKDVDKKSSDAHKPGRAARRSWQKIKWLTAGEQQTKRFVENIRSYQAEFSLELLTFLVTIHGSFPRPQAVDATSQPRLEDPVIRQSSIIIPQTQIQSSGRQVNSLTWAIQSNGSGSCGSQPWIRACFVLPFKSLFSDCMLRGGPVITRPSNIVKKSYSQVDHRNIGFGLDFSLCLPRIYGNKLNIEAMIVWDPSFHRTRLAMFWFLDCVRIVPQQAKIFQCVRTGSMDGVQRMLRSGQASIKDTTIHGITLLHTASGLGHVDLVRFLIEHGADVNAADEDGETPLHRAMSLKNNYAIARLLMEDGADLANVAVGNRTPLHAIFNDTMGRVLTSGDMVEDVGPDSDGMSVSHFLAWSSQTTPAVFELGRASGTVDLWSADKSGKTCLHYAASRGNLDLLGYLLDRASPFEVLKIDNQSLSVIHYAVRSSRMVAVLELLRAKGLNMSTMDADLQNVLHHAARWQRLEVIEKLIALEDERLFLRPDKSGLMPSEIAYKFNSSAVYLYLQHLESTRRHTKETGKAQISQGPEGHNPTTISYSVQRIAFGARIARRCARFLHSCKKSIGVSTLVCLVLMAFVTLRWDSIQQSA